MFDMLYFFRFLEKLGKYEFEVKKEENSLNCDK